MELVELLVRMDCLGCERKVRKQLSKLKGVDSIEIDLNMNKVTVYGYVDRKKVLKAVRKTGKRAEFWQESFNRVAKYSNDGSHDDTYSYSYNGPSFFGSHILKNHPFKRTYNYVKHGYNHYDFGNDERNHSYNSPSRDVPSIFSDENPNNCSIM